MIASEPLLERARKLDSQALAEIYERYAEPIYRYLFRYLGDASHAEDLTGEVFLRLLQALRTQRGPRERLDAWLYRVAHNLAMDWFRQRRKQGNLSLDEHSDSLEREEVSSERHEELPWRVLVKNQEEEQLRAALRRLTPEQQQVLLLRFGEGLKPAEVGALMGKSEGAIKVLQYRAVKRLKKLLAGEEKTKE
ncbi:MAG: sigma-70 family RNA polymerase sigma factor [Anaerolineae bacterium]